MAHEKTSDKKFENLHKQQYTIEFCAKLKKMVTETKDMLDAAFNESTISQTNTYHWYNEFKNDWNDATLMGGSGTPTTVLTKHQLWPNQDPWRSQVLNMFPCFFLH